MKILIIGYGTQGKKRLKFINKNSKVVGIVDPLSRLSNYKSLDQVPISSYDTVFLCTPDMLKEEYIVYFIKNKKNILVEKPLIVKNINRLNYLEKLIKKNKIVIYTAYNHRFEPNFINANKIIKSGVLGKIYSCRLFYGNGTARLVKNSPWRDKNSGVFSDLAPHLIDLCYFWFGTKLTKDFKLVSSFNHENSSPDHVVIKSSNKNFNIELEMTLCMWRNSFYCDIIGENGSLHIDSMCKWGPSTLIQRKRKLPSGVPTQKLKKIITNDPTWAAEFSYFNKLIKNKFKPNLTIDKLILKNINKIEKEIKNSL